MRASRMLRPGVLALVLAVLAACGSGNDNKTSATTAPTPSVTYASSVPATAVVTLDGTASKAAGGGALTYSWVLTAVPTGSTATIGNATGSQATLATDLVGTYTVTLTVSDGSSSQAVALPIAAVAYTAPTILADLVEPLSGTVRLSLSADQGTSTVNWTADGNAIGSGATVSWNTTALAAGAHTVVAQVQSIGKYAVNLSRTFQVAQSPIAFTSATVTESGGVLSAIVGVQSPNGILKVDATLDGTTIGTLAARNSCIAPVDCATAAPNGYGFGSAVGSGPHVVVVTATDGTGGTLGTQLRLTVTDVP